MEIIVTDERDERFIEFCNSFGCFLEEPQVVLLLINFGKTVGCSSFKVYDGDSAEITVVNGGQPVYYYVISAENA